MRCLGRAARVTPPDTSASCARKVLSFSRSCSSCWPDVPSSGLSGCRAWLSVMGECLEASEGEPWTAEPWRASWRRLWASHWCVSCWSGGTYSSSPPVTVAGAATLGAEN
eukprot:scaffold625_cov420-Prasinococcus_capsulatus_cf.AAC.26